MMSLPKAWRVRITGNLLCDGSSRIIRVSISSTAFLLKAIARIWDGIIL